MHGCGGGEMRRLSASDIPAIFVASCAGALSEFVGSCLLDDNFSVPVLAGILLTCLEQKLIIDIPILSCAK